MSETGFDQSPKRTIHPEAPARHPEEDIKLPYPEAEKVRYRDITDELQAMGETRRLGQGKPESSDRLPTVNDYSFKCEVLLQTAKLALSKDDSKSYRLEYSLIKALDRFKVVFKGDYLSITLRTLNALNTYSESAGGYIIDDFVARMVDSNADFLSGTYDATQDRSVKQGIYNLFKTRLLNSQGGGGASALIFFIHHFDLKRMRSASKDLPGKFFEAGIRSPGAFSDEAGDGVGIADTILDLAGKTFETTKSSKDKLAAIGAMANASRDGYSTVSRNLAARISKATGVDGKKILDAWEQVLTGEDDEGGRVTRFIKKHLDRTYPEFIRDNFETIAELEKSRPGICKTLFEEFGIRCFARHYRDTLVSQYDNRDKDIPYGIAIYPYSDWNGAFSARKYFAVTPDLLLISLWASRYGLRIYEAGNRGGVVRALASANKRYGDKYKISFALIGGHGTEESIKFGEEKSTGSHSWKPIPKRDLGEITQDDLEIGSRKGEALRSLFVENPTIILDSCSTGADAGFGEDISKIGANVIAPKKPTSIAFAFAARGLRGNRLHFTVRYRGRGSTMHFANPKAPKS